MPLLQQCLSSCACAALPFTIPDCCLNVLDFRTMQQQKNTLPVPVSSRVRRGVLQTPNEKIHFRGPRKIFKTEMVLQGNRSGCTTSLLPTHYSRICSSQISLLQQPECDADMIDTSMDMKRRVVVQLCSGLRDKVTVAGSKCVPFFVCRPQVRVSKCTGSF